MFDPGFDDWGDYDDSGNASGATPAQSYADASQYAGYDTGPEPMQEPSYPQAPAANARMPRPAYTGSIPAPEPEQAITVIFKNGSRAPESIQNYLMNSKTLTDLDRQHYEQIPLDQIDIAATEKTNRAHGLEFQVPTASHE